MKIDCNITENYFKELKRMCKNFPQSTCIGCPIRQDNDACGFYLKHNGEKTIKTVQEWSDAHQQKTYLEDLLEKYPKVKLNSKGYPDDFCPNNLGYVHKKLRRDEKTGKHIASPNCLKCWNQIMEEEE